MPRVLLFLNALKGGQNYALINSYNGTTLLRIEGSLDACNNVNRLRDKAKHRKTK